MSQKSNYREGWVQESVRVENDLNLPGEISESAPDGCDKQVEILPFEKRSYVINTNSELNASYVIDPSVILGTGASGSVIKCSHRMSGIQYALKTLSKGKFSKENTNGSNDEIKIMMMLDHPNILRLHESFETEDSIYLILELCSGGELLGKLNDQPNHRFSEELTCKLVHDILGAVRYCHDHKITHRDLKLENFLFDNQFDNATIKLIDFGLSCFYNSSQHLTECIGTPYYVAPEVLNRKYNEKCDVWSIGVMAYMMLTGQPLFNGPDDTTILRAVKKGHVHFNPNVTGHISNQAMDFLQHCLVKRPSRRFSAKEAQQHCWFSSIINNKEGIISSQLITNLHNYSNKKFLSRLFLFILSHTMNSDDITDIIATFQSINISESGTVIYDELEEALQPFDLHPMEVNKIFSSMDTEKTGKIHYHQFIPASMSLDNHQMTEQIYQSAFYLLSHGKEYITNNDIEIICDRYSWTKAKNKWLVEDSTSYRLTYADFKGILFAIPSDKLEEEEEDLTSLQQNLLYDMSTVTQSMSMVESRPKLSSSPAVSPVVPVHVIKKNPEVTPIDTTSSSVTSSSTPTTSTTIIKVHLPSVSSTVQNSNSLFREKQQSQQQLLQPLTITCPSSPHSPITVTQEGMTAMMPSPTTITSYPPSSPLFVQVPKPPSTSSPSHPRTMVKAHSIRLKKPPAASTTANTSLSTRSAHGSRNEYSFTALSSSSNKNNKSNQPERYSISSTTNSTTTTTTTTIAAAPINHIHSNLNVSVISTKQSQYTSTSGSTKLVSIYKKQPSHDLLPIKPTSTTSTTTSVPIPAPVSSPKKMTFGSIFGRS